MSQTVVAEQAAAFAGMKADAGNDDVLSRAGEGAIPFGKLVSLGTLKDSQAKLPAAAGDVTDVKKVLGVSLQSHAMEQNGAGAATYDDKDMVSIMHKGRCYVKVQEAVSPTDTVAVRHVAGGDGLGSFQKTADANHALLAGARYLSTAGAGGLALLEVDL